MAKTERKFDLEERTAKFVKMIEVRPQLRPQLT